MQCLRKGLMSCLVHTVSRVFWFQEVNESDKAWNYSVGDHLAECCSMALVHSWNRTMRQTPVARNYHLAAIPRMNRLIYYQTGHSRNTRQMVISSNRCLMHGTIHAVYECRSKKSEIKGKPARASKC